MKAIINGISVNGTPEEIKAFQELNAKKNTTTTLLDEMEKRQPFKLVDDVPEHVKNYGKHDYSYTLKAEGNRLRAWFKE